MPSHWTYDTHLAQSDLEQGDILGPNDALKAVFAQVHPHFKDSKYTAFIVTSQSCDLVLRKEVCATRYINVAVVRELEGVLNNFLLQTCRSAANGIYYQSSKSEARKLIERLCGQNEQSLGLFYLHPDIDSGIATPSVAILRVSVALKAEHYTLLQAARVGRLSNEFRSKLGWLVGNLYSRIGTQDWTETKDRQRQLKGIIDELLNGKAEQTPRWVDDALIESAMSNGIALDELQRDVALAALEKYKPEPPKSLLIKEIVRVAKDVFPTANEADLTRLGNRLNNDPLIAKAFKRAVSTSED